uniref:Sec-independent protein translocase protein TatA n=1 Tax=Anthurium amnicola TaxID=1678845 RepID=A0A1D1XJZ3_9ARAE
MASAAASLLACSLPAKPSSSYFPSSSSCYYYSHSPLSSGSSGFFRDGEGRQLWSSKRAVRLVSRRVGGGAHTASPSSSLGALGCRCLFGLGVPELVVIAGVAALVFGPKKLPEIGRSIGKTVKSFQQAAKEFETELKKEPEENVEPPASEKPISVNNGDEKKELKASGTNESM